MSFLPPASNLYLPLLLTHSGKDHVGRERKENIYMATFSELHSQEKFALQTSVTSKLQLIFKGPCHLTTSIILVLSEESLNIYRTIKYCEKTTYVRFYILFYV